MGDEQEIAVESGAVMSQVIAPVGVNAAVPVTTTVSVDEPPSVVAEYETEPIVGVAFAIPTVTVLEADAV